jgi:hypothetical protein
MLYNMRLNVRGSELRLAGPPADTESAIDFRRSSGWSALDRTFAISPMSRSVAEDRMQALRSCAPFGRSFSFGCDDTESRSGSLALSNVDGTCRPWTTSVGYANDAKRKGRGMRSAARASGSSSHDLW